MALATDALSDLQAFDRGWCVSPEILAISTILDGDLVSWL